MKLFYSYHSYKIFLFFCICLIIFNGSLAGQNNAKNLPQVSDFEQLPIDSSLAWLQENAYLDSNNFQVIGLHILNKAYAIGTPALIADVHTQLANWHGYHGFFSNDSVVYHSEKSLQYYLEAGDKTKTAYAYKSLSIDYLNSNENDKAQEVLFKCLAMFEEIGDEKGIAGAYRNLSTLYSVMDESEQSIKYADLAIPLYEKFDDFASIAITHFNYIQGYTKLGEYEKAYAAADRCIEIVNTKAKEEVFVEVRAYSYRGDVGLANKDYEQALNDFTKAWQLCVDLVGEERATTYRTEVGNALRLMERYEEAIVHLEAGIAAYERQGSSRIWEPYFNIAECYRELGQHKKALYYRDKSFEIKEKILEDKVTNLETEAVVKYETGKKDQALLAQEMQIEQNAKIQNLIIGIAALLATLLFVLFYNFRKNKKITQVLEVKNKENELLLREIHHRVKNNLQTISSLLNLQSESINDSKALDAVQESKNRVASMALIHQKLYQGENLAAIEMRDYFETIGRAIISSFGKKAEHVTLDVKMDNFELDVDTAVPIGLITNELITNSIKYAFPKQKPGRIFINLEKEENDLIKLIISDNGSGHTETDDQTYNSGFGTLLVNLLTTQLRGKLEKSNQQGTTIKLQFPLQTKSVA